MSKMSCVLVLCVLLLVSQVEMLPVKLVPSGLENTEGAVELAALANQVMDTTMEVNGVLSRLKRHALANSGNNKCSNGMTELWHDGPCVTCEKYMEFMDTDECPGYD